MHTLTIIGIMIDGLAAAMVIIGAAVTKPDEGDAKTYLILIGFLAINIVALALK